MRQTWVTRRGIGGAMLAALLGCALVLSGCGPPRSLPDRADPQTYASLDICEAVDIGQVRKDHPDVEMQRTGNVPASCAVSLGADSHDPTILVGIIAKVPDAVRTHGGEGTTDESVDGGTVVHLDTDDGCGSYAFSDSGIWLQFIVQTERGATPAEQQCQAAETLAKAAVTGLDREVPTIDWPAGSLFTKDICARAEDSGLAASLGVDAEPTVNPTHLVCSYSAPGSAPGPINGLVVSVDMFSGWSDPPLPHRQRLTIAGRTAELNDTQAGQASPTGGALCAFEVDHGANSALADRHPDQTRESLHVSLMTREPYDCEDAVPAITTLLEALA